MAFINKTKHSRIPVYEENLDRVIGMIHIRDLFEKINKNVKIKKDIKTPKKPDSSIISPFLYPFIKP